MIVTEAELRERCRPFSQNYSAERVAPAVLESQQADIKPQVGDTLFVRLLSPEYAGAEPYKTFLEGGVYTPCCGGQAVFDGLKTALAYYAYARLITSNVNYLGTTGLRTAVDNTAVKAEYDERERVRLDVRRMAESYMADALRYAHGVEELRALLPGCGCNGSGKRQQFMAVVDGVPPREYGDRYTRFRR